MPLIVIYFISTYNLFYDNFMRSNSLNNTLLIYKPPLLKISLIRFDLIKKFTKKICVMVKLMPWFG